jgi:hypothetical protein
MSVSELKKQVEYYLSDRNLQHDQFFHDKIASNAEGWLDIVDILNCNKVKKLKATTEKHIRDAIVDSTEVEVSADGKKIRRKDGKALPELAKKGDEAQKKRDAKNATKEEEKVESGKVEYDEKGYAILVNADFENPIIVHFKT